jgi:hypothetical protein
MALSANRTDFDVAQDDRGLRITPEVKNASVIYYGALCSCDTDTGSAKPYDGTESDKLLGWHNSDSVTGATASSPPPRAQLITGPFFWEDCPLGGGIAGTNADIGKRVWATDDGTYTSTDPGGGAEVGVIVMYKTSSVADVVMKNVLGYVDSFSPLPTPTPTPTPT